MKERSEPFAFEQMEQNAQFQNDNLFSMKKQTNKRQQKSEKSLAKQFVLCSNSNSGGRSSSTIIAIGFVYAYEWICVCVRKYDIFLVLCMHLIVRVGARARGMPEFSATFGIVARVLCVTCVCVCARCMGLLFFFHCYCCLLNDENFIHSLFSPP